MSSTTEELGMKYIATSLNNNNNKNQLVPKVINDKITCNYFSFLSSDGITEVLKEILHA